MPLHHLLCGPFLTILLLSAVAVTGANAETISLPNGKSVEIPDGVPPEARQKMMEAMMKEQGKREQKEASKDKGNENKEKKNDPKKEDKQQGKKENENKQDQDTVSRPKAPKNEPDKDELKAMPEDGHITLQFQGHPWPAMIQWYSRATGREIEWQELPSGFINLRTQRPFTMKETGDLLNRLLLARGFTILDDGDFMQVIKLEGLNPAFVPRVSAQQLATLGSHSFVRVSFQLKRFKAEELAKELEAMKSKHGVLVPMTAANRIEAMDTVRNLRDIFMAIDAEQNSGSHAPREFEIQYLRAANVKKKLDEMFQDKSGPVLTPQQLQKMKEQQQRSRSSNGKQPPKPSANAAGKISIVVNELRNSIIVKAPPHIMIDVAAAVELLDVALTRDTLDIKAYSLATRSPQELAEILNESGALSPSAIVRVDKKTKALLVSGNRFDHFKIEELIKKIDGNPRRFESIRLRRYPAIQVATTIESMMGKPKEENKRKSRYYGYWNDDEEDENPNDVFRVTADVENNRLILKCNDSEYDMVIELLTQMGEVMTRSKYAASEIVLDVDSGDAFLERVRDLFNRSSENEVILPPPLPKPLRVEDNDSEGESDGEEEIEDVESEITNEVNTTSQKQSSKTALLPRPYQTLLVQVDASSAAAELQLAQKPKTKAPPIIIHRNAQKKLVIRCDDPAALEKFEELLRQLAPPAQDWVHFKMKHVTASWMRLQLKDFFDADEDETNVFIWDYWGGGDDKDDAPPGLGDEKKMRFIDDGDSTLVVRNASARQLATVKELIALYDVAVPPNPQNARFKEIIQIQYSTPRIIETTLKDAFRDLLSSNDKAFGQKKGGDEGEGRGRRMGPFGFSESTTSALQGTSFKGKISFGVDESTNRLIVTAEGKKLLGIIVEMVHELDQAAQPKDDTRVITVPAGVNRETLRQTLTRMFGPESITTKPQGGKKNGEQQEQKQGQNARQPRRK